MPASKQFSNSRFLFSFTAFFFFQQQLLSHTCNMRSHLSPGYLLGPWQCDIIRVSCDCAWLCCYFNRFLLLFLHTMHEQHSHTSEFAPCDIFQVRGWKNILQICPVAAIGSGTVQLNADLNHASSFRLTHTTAPVNISVSQVSVPKKA